MVPNRRDFAAYIDDRPKDGVFRVDRAIYNDPEILEAEYRNIFEANWVFLCHDAHVRSRAISSHAYRTSTGVRGAQAGRHARLYLNACGHRGATLVTHAPATPRASSARITASASTPPGKCTAVSTPKTGWTEARFDMSNFDLTPVARLDSYRGLVFGSLAATCRSLRDHLGAATALIDIFVAPAPQELEIVAGFSIYQTACNWKIMHENGPDAYHAPVVHNNFARPSISAKSARSAPVSPRPTPAGSRVASSRQATISATATPHSGTSGAIRRRSRSMRRRPRWRSSSRRARSSGFSDAAAT